MKIAICATVLFSSFQTFSQTDVLTQHNDLARTGWNNQETVLNTTNVKSSSFGKLFSVDIDEEAYAQPLVVTGVNITSAGTKNVVYACTLNNTVYAIDADNGTLYWAKNFTPANYRVPIAGEMHPALCGGSYYDIANNIGIVGTPVINKAANTMYFVTKVVNKSETVDNHIYKTGLTPDDEYNYSSTGFHQYLHAISLSTGSDTTNSPVEITAAYPGTGDGTDGTYIYFDPRRQFNRGGLALSHGIVYIPFAAHCDWDPCHGWLLGYNAATLAPKIVYATTPNDGRGGIWMSGAAPAVDANGNIYVTTGNANEGQTTNPGVNVYSDLPSVLENRGDGVIELTPNKLDTTATSLSVNSYFTPFNYSLYNQGDWDFSIQTLLLPGTSMVATACKDDSLYLMAQSSLGGYNPSNNSVLQTIYLNPASGAGELHASLAYFGGATTKYLYQLGEKTVLQAIPVNSNSLGAPVSNGNASAWPNGDMGGFLSVSSNGSNESTGVLWVLQSQNGCPFSPCHGILRAMKASDINTELWNSDMNATDNLNNLVKMNCPTIANGKVYVTTIPTSYPASTISQLVVYGITHPLPLTLIDFSAENVNNQYADLKWATSGEMAFDYFEVQRSSNGQDFTDVAKVGGHGNSNVTQDYSALDDKPAPGINYYRLKEVDLNGTVNYSNIVTADFEGFILPKIIPNPAKSYFIVIAGTEPLKEISLIDASGKIIVRIENNNSTANINIPIDKLPDGIYIVEIKTSNQVLHQKLLKN